MAYRIGRGKLVVVDIDEEGKFSNEKVLRDGWDIPGWVRWSPDSRWLTYAYADLNFNNEIYIHAADNSKEPVNISMHPRSENFPFWSKDGSKLGFVSERNNGDEDIWFVWLNKKDWQKTKEDWDEGDEDEDKPKDKKKKDDDEDEKKEETVEPIVIDFEDIHERITQVTSLPGGENNLIISDDGEFFYFTAGSPTTKGNDIYKIKWDGKDIETVTSGGVNASNLKLSPDGKHIYYLKSGGNFARLDIDGGKSETLSFSANLKIDFAKELDQIFEEAWRTLRDGFYDPNFHGKDWDQLKKKYKPWCLSASTKIDFNYMFNTMLGELNASHMGIYGSDRAETQTEKVGLLGIEIEPVSNGIKIKRVVPDTPADREASKLMEGDVIKSVNGENLGTGINFYSKFINTTDEKVLLVVEAKDGKEREVIIRPASSISNQLYDEWVDDRRELTNKYSNGKLGYLHIEAMGWSSFERFETELAAAGYGKEGIVIDVRYNGGGWTTDYLMAVLNVKQHAYTVPRGATDNLEKNHKKFRETYPFAERLPFYPWTKPSIAICNANSYSNAEIFSHAYKTLDIGTLVGIPTFGAVISTGGQRLIDGSLVRLPFRAWYVKATDENMEWGPAVPDIIVENSPDAKVKGIDEQLKTAVDELMKTIN
ncbi:MAG: PDZ domain-containing protein [Melioribacteraceae bacterium]|nr:PDZ domain-containing protein [Melioribacteraceae bacterium]MCF8263552.1 PDZ domain-containing protein [Melioribacteraceae bacterium]MCF8430678.1 PDZ domain-containing protein [Melioribacteraceae bacterium]